MRGLDYDARGPARATTQPAADQSAEQKTVETKAAGTEPTAPAAGGAAAGATTTAATHQIARAIREGVRPDGSQLYSIMPYLNYNRLGDDDTKALVAFLRTIKPIEKVTAEPGSEDPEDPGTDAGGQGRPRRRQARALARTSRR